VRQRGKEAYKLKLTNKNCKDCNGLESGRQVVGPMSAQMLVDWRLSECGNKFIGECTEAKSMMGVEAAYGRDLRFSQQWFMKISILFHVKTYSLFVLDLLCSTLQPLV
jgi:hypothetical protein